MSSKEDQMAEVSSDLDAAARKVWEEIRRVAGQAPIQAAEHEGAAGYLWEGKLLHVMERFWPVLGATDDIEVNRVRRNLHNRLTRALHVLHCVERGAPSTTPPRVPTWWVSAEWDVFPQREVWRQERRMRGIETRQGRAPEVAAEAAPVAEEPLTTTDYVVDPADTAAMLHGLIYMAERMGSPLTSTVVSMLPTGASMRHRARALSKLVEDGLVAEREVRFLGQDAVRTPLVWVSLQDPEEFLVFSDYVRDDAPDTEAPASAADMLERFLADYRTLEKDSRDREELISDLEKENAELSEFRATVRKAMGF